MTRSAAGTRRGSLGTSELFVGGLCSAVILASAVLWAATGARMFTRFPDEALEQANAETDLGALFGDTGLNEELGEMERVESEFTFGLLPAGPSKASLAVMTIAGPALAFAPLFVVVRRRMKKGKNSSLGANETKADGVHQSAA